jgi:hypothetical protein
VADLDEFLVYKLHATLTGYFQKLDLRLYEKVKSQLGYEQTRPWTSRVTDSRPDVQHREVLGWVHLLERVTEDGVGDVVYAGTTAQLLGRDLGGSTVDG